jgi:hypothetical protein
MLKLYRREGRPPLPHPLRPAEPPEERGGALGRLRTHSDERGGEREIANISGKEKKDHQPSKMLQL